MSGMLIYTLTMGVQRKFQYLKEHNAEFIELRAGLGQTCSITTIARYSALEERS